MPPDVRRSRADLRSTHATDHLIARAAAIEATNLRARKQRTDQVCQTIANPPYFQRRHPTQACKILYSRSPRVRYAARAKQFCNWLIRDAPTFVAHQGLRTPFRMTAQQLLAFGPFAPDTVHRIGDLSEGLRQAYPALGNRREHENMPLQTSRSSVR